MLGTVLSNLLFNCCMTGWNFVCMSSRYLAVMAGMASEADFVFIPEDPAQLEWPEKICNKLSQASYISQCCQLSYISIEMKNLNIMF